MIVGLWEKYRARWNTAIIEPKVPRGDDYLDRGPSVADGGGKLQSIHRTGHIDIRKYNGDVCTRLEDLDCLIGIPRFDGFEARVLNDIHCHHSQQRFVFNDENSLAIGLLQLSPVYSVCCI